jgi:GDP/UDP-N,N'-diacetylbacillosamine 2-epimerase (hydrolysing)
MNKIGFLTTTRADFSILKPLINIIDLDSSFEYQLIVSGTHLDSKYGYTIDEIKNNNIKVHSTVPYNIDTSSPFALVDGQSCFIKGLQKVIESSDLDCIVLVGDRYEIAYSALTFVINSVPIVHIHGGEVTEGANDDIFRNIISKCALLHFASTENHKKRIIKMGENPEMVFNTGALGLFNIQTTNLFLKEKVFEKLKLKKYNKSLVVTFNPETNLSSDDNIINLNHLLEALKYFDNCNIIITSCNADLQGMHFNKIIKNWSNKFDNVVFYNSLGSKLYHSIVKYSDCVVGNSSSGIIEAPSLKTLTLNVGDRQKGRDMGSSVINVKCETKEIIENLKFILTVKKTKINFKNPYENPNVTNKMLKLLKSIDFKNSKLKKYKHSI